MRRLLLSTYDHCLRSVDYVNVVVAGKQPQPNWLPMDEAIEHCTRGLGILPWAGTETEGTEPDVVLACAGEVPTMETLAAADLLRTHLPGLAVRVINVVDLMRLQPASEHPHGLSDRDFDALFTTVSEAVAKGEKVSIPGWIAFEQVDTAARTGRNPQTGAEIKIPAGKRVKVSAGSKLKAAVK